MASVKVLAKLRYDGTTPEFYDISPRVNYENLSWESNSEGTSANCNFQLWTILPKSASSFRGYPGATETEQINNAILDESFVIEIPNRTEIRIVDQSQTPNEILFAGIITRVSTNRSGNAITQDVECADNTAILEEHIVADYYAPRDARDIDIINGGTSYYTVASSLPQVIGQIDSLSLTAEPTGGNLTNGTYYVRMQPISSSLVGRDGLTPQFGPATKESSIVLSGGTSTQKIKVAWKNAQLATSHRIYIRKNSLTSTEYLGKSINTIPSSVVIINATRANNVVTVETKTNHGFIAGDPIVISIPQSSGFSVERTDYVAVESRISNTKFTYKKSGDDGAASTVNATASSGSFAYITSLTTTGSPTSIDLGSARGWADGEVYHLSEDQPGQRQVGVDVLQNGYYDGSYFRLGIGDDNIRGWQFPANVFGSLFDKNWLEEINLDTREKVQAVDTKYRFSPYFNESDTPNAEQFGGRTLRNILDYISEKTGAEYWVDRGYFDELGNYKCNLNYRSKTTKELVQNGIYDGTLDGWISSTGFSISQSNAGPYGSGYAAYSSIENSYIEQTESSRTPVTSGQKYFVAVRGKASDHQNRWGAYVDWYDSSGTEIHSDHIGNLSQAGDWERIWKIVTVPNDAVKASVRGVCTDQQHGSAYFTDWSMVLITGQMGYGDFEDLSYPVPIYEMEIPSSPVESGNTANRLHLYAVFRTKNQNGDKIALVDSSGNPVQYVDYDFTPGIWATNGKIVEAAITDERVETLADAELSAAAYWKENGLPIESYTFEMRPRDAYEVIYPVPEVGDVIPFVWSVMGVAKPLIVKAVQGKLQGTEVVYTITVGGDIRLQRSSFIRLSEKIKELSAVNPIPNVPDRPEELSAVSNDKSVSLSWRYNETSDVNKKISSFEVQRQEAIYKAIESVSRSGQNVTVTTSEPHGLVVNETIRIDLNTSSASLTPLEGQWTVSSTTTTSFTFVSTESGTINSTVIDGWVYYNFGEYRAIQNSKSTYMVDSGLSPALQYRYKVRALSSEGTSSDFTNPTEPITPSFTEATVKDGSVTLQKLQSTLRPIQIISEETLPILNPSGLADYPEGMIVYHLGGTPPGLRRVYKDESLPEGSQWSWQNAVGNADILANAITSEKISTVGLDAAVIKSGQLTIDDRFGLSGISKEVIAYGGDGTRATIYTQGSHGITSGLFTIAGLGETFDGSKTYVDNNIVISQKQKVSNIATLRTSKRHALVAGDNVNISGIDAAFNGGPYAVDTVHSNVTYKQRVGNIVTLSTHNAHGFNVNDAVTIAGADDPFNASDQSPAIVNGTFSNVTFKQHDGTKAMLTTQYAHGYQPGDSVVVSSGVGSPFAGTVSVTDISTEVNYPARYGSVATLRTNTENPIVANDQVLIQGIGAPYDGTVTVTNTSAPIHSYQTTGRSYGLSHAGRAGNRAIVRTTNVQTIAKDDILTISGTTSTNQTNATVLGVGATITESVSGVAVTNRQNGGSAIVTAISMNGGTYAAAGTVIARATGRAVSRYAVAATVSATNLATVTLTTGRLGSTTGFAHFMQPGEKISVRNFSGVGTNGMNLALLNGVYTIKAVPSSSTFTYDIPGVYTSISTTTLPVGSTNCVVGEYAEVVLSGSSNFPTSAGTTAFDTNALIITGVGANYNSFDIETATNEFYLPPSTKAAQVGTRTIRIHVANVTLSAGSIRPTTAATSLATNNVVSATYPVFEWNSATTSLDGGYTAVANGSISNSVAYAACSNINAGNGALSTNQVVKLSGFSDSRFNVITSVSPISGVTSSGFFVRLKAGTSFLNLSNQTAKVTNGVVTLTTASAHGFSANTQINVAGITAQSAYNGLWTIASVPSTTTLTYKETIQLTDIYADVISGETATLNSAGTITNGTITFTTQHAHGFIANDSVDISDLGTAYNGTYTVITGSSTGAAPATTFSVKKSSLDTSFVGETLTSLTGYATSGRSFSYTTTASTNVNWNTSTGSAAANETTFVSTIPHGFIAGDTVTISGITGAGSGLNGTFPIARDGIRIESVQNTLGSLTVTCAAPHGLSVNDYVTISGVGFSLDGNYLVESISQVSGTGNPDQFSVTKSGNTSTQAITPTDAAAANGRIFRIRAGATALAYTVAAAGSASSGKTFSYTTAGSDGYIPKSYLGQNGSVTNGKIFKYIVSSSAIARTAASGTSDNYKTFRYQTATSGFIAPIQVSPYGSATARNYKTFSYTVSGVGSVAPTATSSSFASSARVIRYANTTNQETQSVSNASVQQKLSVYAIQSPNFSVDYTGQVTATSANISGTVTASGGTIGGWLIGSTSLTGGSVTLSSDGNISVGTNGLYISSTNASYVLWAGNASPTNSNTNFRISDTGVVTAKSATLTSATMSELNITAGTEAGITIAHSGTYGDIVAPDSDTISLGHTSNPVELYVNPSGVAHSKNQFVVDSGGLDVTGSITVSANVTMSGATGLTINNGEFNHNQPSTSGTSPSTSGLGAVWATLGGTAYQLRRYVSTSTRATKKNIADTSITADNFYRLRLVDFEFDMNEIRSRYPSVDLVPEGLQRGVIWEEVNEILPEAANPGINQDPPSINWERIYFAGLVAVQDLNSRVIELEARVAELEG